jgi:hypothetical protein
MRIATYVTLFDASVSTVNVLISKSCEHKARTAILNHVLDSPVGLRTFVRLLSVLRVCARRGVNNGLTTHLGALWPHWRGIHKSCIFRGGQGLIILQEKKTNEELNAIVYIYLRVALP